jgi:molecular chaperone GrpE (heat shock protein)
MAVSVQLNATQTWKDIVRAALFDPVLHAAVTLHNQSSVNKEQALIAAALALVEINKKQREQIVDAMREGYRLKE